MLPAHSLLTLKNSGPNPQTSIVGAVGLSRLILINSLLLKPHTQPASEQERVAIFPSSCIFSSNGRWLFLLQKTFVVLDANGLKGSVKNVQFMPQEEFLLFVCFL